MFENFRAALWLKPAVEPVAQERSAPVGAVELGINENLLTLVIARNALGDGESAISGRTCCMRESGSLCCWATHEQ